MKVINGVFSICNIRVVSVNTHWSDKHESVHIILVVRVSLNELRDCTSHEVWFIYLIFLTDGGHWVSENFRHSQTGLVGVFLHRHFLSSFCIRETSRLTVSRILSFLGLLDGVLFLSPNKVLSSGFCWSLFIGFTPVQQSFQEYLEVLMVTSWNPLARSQAPFSVGLKGILDVLLGNFRMENSASF